MREPSLHAHVPPIVDGEASPRSDNDLKWRGNHGEDDQTRARRPGSAPRGDRVLLGPGAIVSSAKSEPVNDIALKRDEDEVELLLAHDDDDDGDGNSASRSGSRDRSRDMTTADRSYSRDRSLDRTGDGAGNLDRSNSRDRSRDRTGDHNSADVSRSRDRSRDGTSNSNTNTSSIA
jgi:hypothetical protein